MMSVMDSIVGRRSSMKCPICGDAIPDGRGVVFGGTHAGWFVPKPPFLTSSVLAVSILPYGGKVPYFITTYTIGTICKACFKGER